jgi:integrase
VVILHEARKKADFVGYRIVTRKHNKRHPVLVFDFEDRLHFPLTIFGAEAVKRSSTSTARVYLSAIVPFFSWLEGAHSANRVGGRWDNTPQNIQQVVGDYLIECLRCKLKEHPTGFQLVSLTAGTRATVRVFLSALKLFYQIMRAQDRYEWANPLVDGPAAILTQVEDWLLEEALPLRMPHISGVVLPRKRRLSDSYFKIVGESWVPQVIDDPELPGRVQSGGKLVGWRLREQCIARILFESGCRVSEVVGLSLADWVGRGLLQEAQAFTKGSHGRRVKFIRFSASTAKLLRRYFDTERRQFDREHYVLDDYLREAHGNRRDLYEVPLFLSRSGTQVTTKAFREGCWNPACRAAGIDADVHQARHWYVTQAIRGIYETSRSEADINRRLRELIEYMGWKSGWETLQAYEHYFNSQRHSEIQDQLHRKMDSTLNAALAAPSACGLGESHSHTPGAAEAHQPNGKAEMDSDLEYLLTLGGRRGAEAEQSPME